MKKASKSYEDYLKYTKKLEILGYPTSTSWVKVEYKEADFNNNPERFIIKDINIGNSGVLVIPEFVTSIASGYRAQKTQKIKIVYRGNYLISLMYLLHFKNIETIDLTEFNMKNIRMAERLFMGMQSLKQIKLPKEFGCNLLQATQMFDGTQQLEEIDLRKFDLSKLNHYTNFIRLQGAKRIYLGKFGQKFAKRITHIVNSCHNLDELIIEELDISSARQIYDVIINCRNIKTIKINTIGNQVIEPVIRNFIINCNQDRTVELTGTITQIEKG